MKSVYWASIIRILNSEVWLLRDAETKVIVLVFNAMYKLANEMMAGLHIPQDVLNVCAKSSMSPLKIVDFGNCHTIHESKSQHQQTKNLSQTKLG